MPTYMKQTTELPAGSTALHFCCDKCKETLSLVLPIPVRTVAAMGKAFMALHEHKDDE